MHIEADPVFSGFDICTSITQFSQDRIQRIGLCVTADDLTAGNSRGYQEGPGFDTVGQNAIHTATQAFNAFDGDTVGTLAGDLRPQGIQEVRRVHDLRLARGVLDDGGAFCQRSRRHDGDSGANAHLIHHDMRALQATINGGFDVALFQFDFSAQLLEAKDMQIDRTRTNGAAARQ